MFLSPNLVNYGLWGIQLIFGLESSKDSPLGAHPASILMLGERFYQLVYRTHYVSTMVDISTINPSDCLESCFPT